MLTELFEDGHTDILEALKNRKLSLQRVYQAKRAGQLPYVFSELVLTDPLWQAVKRWLPRCAPRPRSRKRYEVSFKALKRASVLSELATVADLAKVDWVALQLIWPNSGADWNRLRSAVSRFMTMTLGDKFHPFRRKLLTSFPKANESTGRVPDLTPSLFWAIVNEAPEHIRPALVTLAATGLRVGEYLALEPHHLRPLNRGVAVPGTKTSGSESTIYVGENAWQWVKRGVPSPVRYKQLRIHWIRACTAAGASDLRLHDICHFYGQQMSDVGVPEAKIQSALRHADPAMTRRYTRQRDRGEVANTMDEILFPRVSTRGSRGA